LTTYYELLQVDATASSEEIKRAFRKRAKAVHPDVNPDDAETADGMRRLLRAYEVLIDPCRREEYDRRMMVLRPENRFDYRSFLQSRPDDSEFQSRLVFFDLLHHREREAVEVYDRLSAHEEFSLDQHLDREDFLDCGLLLAEEYERQGRLVEAFDLLVAIIRYELEKPYFRHFFVEVTDTLRTLVCRRMPERIPVTEVLRCIDIVLLLGLPPRDRALYMKRAAELHVDLGNAAAAEAWLRDGIRLHANLAGTKKLKERISAFGTV
jgi:hypothetical protein